MRRKIIITATIFIIILAQIIYSPKVQATIDESGVLNNINQIQVADIESPTTGLDTITGVIIEPAVEFFTFLIDALMSVFTSVMGQTEYQDVMVDEVSEIEPLGEPGATITIDDMGPYLTATGKLKIEYPNFKYSSEDIFAGKIDLLDVNFISESNDDENWLNIRKVISQWYQILRMAAIIGLLSVLIYTGIKIIISSNAKDKAKYKEMIINWFIGVILAFSMHYIMIFILSVIEEIMGLFENITGVIEVNAGGTVFKTNLIGFARFQMQQKLFSAKIGHLIIYTALVVYTIKFTFVYLKRVLRMAMLTMISPIVALTYPIDKMEGQAKGFDSWLKEFIFNALLQPVHYILYYILVSTSLTLAARNPLYGIVALAFMSQAERLLKRIFGFEKANQGAVGGIAGAFATGAVTSALMNNVRNPFHLLGGGKSSKISGGKKQLGESGYSDDDMPNDFIDDVNFDDFLTTGVGRDIGTPTTGVSTSEVPTPTNTPLNIGTFISDYRNRLSGYSNEDLGGVVFPDGDSRSIEEMLQELGQYQMLLNDENLTDEQRIQIEEKMAELRSLLQNRATASENHFTTIGVPLQYIDNDARDIRQLTEDMMIYTQLANDMSIPDDMRQSYARNAESSKDTLNRRIAENNYINSQGGAQALVQQHREEETGNRQDSETETSFRTDTTRNEEKNDEKQTPKFVKGMTHVAKTIAKPVWDTDKSTSYNTKKLVKGTLKGAAKVTLGAAVGVTAAAVQAGISITDGKYNPMEGVASVGAGMAFASNIMNKGNGELVRAYKEGANSGEAGRLMKDYSEQWYNRDDVISYYNKEFPGKGKEMRQRVANNYITRGISDMKEQKQAIKFAEKLKKEQGLDEQEADKIAIATLQYKKNLTLGSNYRVLFNEEKRKEYLDIQTDAYSGSASKASVRRLHEDFIKNVLDFDKVNR